MSVVLVTKKRASLKIPYLRYVILGHAKSANEISQSVKHEISFVVGFSTLCCFGGGPYGDGGPGGAQGGRGKAQGGERGGGEGPGGTRGGPQGGRAKEGTRGGRAQGPVSPMLPPCV